MKKKFKRQFTRRVLTRFHMSLILSGTMLSGMLYSVLLIMAGLTHVMARYVLVLVLAYITFFVLMRLWLYYLTLPYRKKRASEHLVDAADVLSSVPDVTFSFPEKGMTGHGGGFGGGGASGSWTASSTGESGSSGAEEALSALGDEGGVLLLVLGLCLAVIFGAGVYLVYEAPMILSEAAFEFLLASSLIKKVKTMDEPNWIGSVFRTTWVPFALALAITILASWAMGRYCPQAIKITDVFMNCL